MVNSNKGDNPITILVIMGIQILKAYSIHFGQITKWTNK